MALAIQQQRSGAAAVTAILLAIGSFIATFSAHPVVGALLALIAILAGAIGVAASVSPRVGGGMLSVASIVLGIFGLGLSVLGMIGALVF
jgi:hypothetical protein